MTRTTTPDLMSPLIKHVTGAYRDKAITLEQWASAMRVLLRRRGVLCDGR